MLTELYTIKIEKFRILEECLRVKSPIQFPCMAVACLRWDRNRIEHAYSTTI